MLSVAPDLIAFWLMPWSQPFRAACRWFTLDTQPLQGRQPDKDAPCWLRPLFLQRWVGQTVAARLAWLQQHPQAQRYGYGKESIACWDAVAWVSYPRHCLRELREDTLLRIFGMEVERLLRIAEESPPLAGTSDWTSAALGASEHLAQLYAELKRRHKAERARAILRDELRRYIEWEPLTPDAEDEGVW